MKLCIQQIYKICLKWIKFQESMEEQEILDEQIYNFSQNFKNTEIQVMFYQYKKSYYISLFRICTLFQIMINILFCLSCFESNHQRNAISRLIFTFWLIISLVIQSRLCQKNWTNLINFFITIDSLVNLIIYSQLYSKFIDHQTDIQQISSMNVMQGLLQAFFALIYLLICPSWQCQIIIIITYFVPLIAISGEFSSYEQLYIYLMILFVCYILRVKDKYTKLMFISLNTQKQNIMACKKIFDECVPSSIIIVKTINNSQQKSFASLQIENEQLISTLQQNQPRCQLLYANQFAQQYLNCCAGFNCVEQIEAISIIQDDNNSRRSLVEVLGSQTWVDKFVGENVEYALGQDQKVMNCYRIIDDSTLIEQKNKKKQYCDVTLRSCIWEGQKSTIIVLNDTTDRVNRIDYFIELNDYKDKLLATVSHDLKTPLNATQLLLFIMKELCQKTKQLDASDIKNLLQYINDIFQSNNMLITMINDLLDYSQMRMGTLRLLSDQFSIDECLKSVYGMFNPQTQQKRLNLIFEKVNFEQSFNLQTDQNRLKQILINLLSNALKFTYEGYIKLKIEIDGTCIQFSVEDTGIGMPQQVVQKLFKSYATFNLGNKNKQGVGLGLVISSKLVGLLGPTETITVQSQEGKGSLFIFKIYRKLDSFDSLIFGEDSHPDYAQEPNMTKASQRQINIIQRTRKIQYQVMIVDDTIFNITAFKLVLQKLLKCQVIDVYNGRDALKQVEQGNEFDLIFMDINMPVMDGHQATKLIRGYEKLQQNVPSTIIMASASTLEQEYDYIRNSGANGLIEKPIQIKKLGELLKHYKFID